MAVDTVTTETITELSGEYSFLSNQYRFQHPIIYGDLFFHTVEHAFQASKTRDEMARRRIAQASSPAIARQISRMSQDRSDWEDVKLTIMETLLNKKFKKNLPLMKALVDTGGKIIMARNQDNDDFWGVIWDANAEKWVGENYLGRLLMKVRGEMRQLIGCPDGDC